jgi:oligopeptide transport system substrate-binding protein
MLYGPMKRPEGPNSTNYNSPEYNRLFEQMRSMEDTPERLSIINRMREISVEDCPWVYLYHDQRLLLVHKWMFNVQPHPVANDFLKYYRVDPALRTRMRAEWNEPNYLPLVAFIGLLVVGTVPAVVSVNRRRTRRVRRSA